MATKAQIQRECDRRNESGRRVREQRSVNLARFWEHTYGDFLIAGGTQDMREDVLVSKVRRCVTESSLPTVILNTSPTLENRLIAMFSDLRMGRLVRITNRYPNYHVFYGLPIDAISRYLGDIAQYSGGHLDILALRSYIHGFLKVVEKKYTPSLQAILTLAAYTDEQIVQIGQQYGVSQMELNAIYNQNHCGAAFRVLIRSLESVMRTITTPECATRRSICSELNGGQTVMMINITSSMPYIMQRYFAVVLGEMLNRRKFRLILNGVQLDSNDGLQDVLRNMMGFGGNEIGLCTANPLIMFQDDAIFSTIRTQVLMRSGIDGPVLQKLLEQFGQYPHYFVTNGGGKKNMFDLLPSASWNIGGPDMRFRVRSQDMQQYTAALHGNSGDEVTLTQNLTGI